MDEHERIRNEIKRLIDDYLYKMKLQNDVSNTFVNQIEDLPWYLKDLSEEDVFHDYDCNKNYSKHL